MTESNSASDPRLFGICRDWRTRTNCQFPSVYSKFGGFDSCWESLTIDSQGNGKTVLTQATTNQEIRILVESKLSGFYEIFYVELDKRVRNNFKKVSKNSVAVFGKWSVFRLSWKLIKPWDKHKLQKLKALNFYRNTAYYIDVSLMLWEKNAVETL